jgi:hypothetical protein
MQMAHTVSRYWLSFLGIAKMEELKFIKVSGSRFGFQSRFQLVSAMRISWHLSDSLKNMDF